MSRFEKDAIPHGTLMRGNPFAVASAVAATQPGSVTVPISQKRMSEIETELAVIVRELDRIEKARAKRPEQPVPLGAAAVTRSGEVGRRWPSRAAGSPISVHRGRHQAIAWPKAFGVLRGEFAV